MKKENLVYIAVLVAVVVLAILVLFKGNLTSNTITSIDNNKINLELEKYRSDEIPEECRLPVYEDDLDWWKKHLSHHENTLYCLDYYQ